MATIYGQYLRDIGETNLLTPQEEVELADRIHAGDEAARDRMIRANLRLVVKIAREFEGLGLPLLDLISEGNIGLMKAVERFDPRKGAKFSTYSAWWIRQGIRRCLSNQSKTIRLPVHMIDKLAKFRQLRARFAEEQDREPTDEEIAKAMSMNPRQVRQMRQAILHPVSLDQPVQDQDERVVGEKIADERVEDPGNEAERENSLGILRHMLDGLGHRESVILAQRFGLDGGEPKTLEEIGQMFGVTRERIRQLEKAALVALRHRFEALDRRPPEPLACGLAA